MIFLVILVFIMAVIGVIYFIDSTNIAKIEQFLNQNQCKTIAYANGSFQALCPNKIIIIDNGFSINFDDAKMIKYKDIKEIEKRKYQLILDTSNEKIELNFKSDENKETYLEKLKDKVNQ